MPLGNSLRPLNENKAPANYFDTKMSLDGNMFQAYLNVFQFYNSSFGREPDSNDEPLGTFEERTKSHKFQNETKNLSQA